MNTKRWVRDVAQLITDPLGGCAVFLGRGFECADPNVLRVVCLAFDVQHGCLEGERVYIQCIFSKHHPSEPPSLQCLSPLSANSHTNFFPEQGQLRICLEMFETDPASTIPGCEGQPYSRWTPAYTLRSVALQLQCLLSEVLVERDEFVAVVQDMAKHEADLLPTLIPLISRPHVELWGSAPSPKDKAQPAPDTPYVGDELHMCRSCLQMTPLSQLDQRRVCIMCEARSRCERTRKVGHALEMQSRREGDMTAAQKRNRRRSEMRRKNVHESNDCIAQQSNAEPQRSRTQARAQEEASAVWKTVIKWNLPSFIVESDSVSQDYQGISGPQVLDAAVENAQGFGRISHRNLQRALVYAEPADLSRLAQTCVLLSQVGSDGYIWREMVGRHFPHNTRRAVSVPGWKHIFRLEVNAVSQSDVTCWHSQLSFRECVLGIPIRYTINPRTRVVDYIHSEIELISHRSFALGLRKTMWGNKFTDWLPVYINDEHFQRAQRYVRSSIVSLCPHRSSKEFNPILVLDVLPRIMNTMVVLLSDEGTPAHDLHRWLRGYLMLLRLFIALVELYPSLKQEVALRLEEFAQNEANRTKEKYPSLGELVTLLSVCESVGWADIGKALFSEALIRGMLWARRDVPALGTHTQHVSQPDVTLLADVFVALRVSFRLFMFHCCIMQLFCTPHGALMSQTARYFDRLLGFPPSDLTARLLRNFNGLVQVDNWSALYAALSFPCPCPLELTNQLVDSHEASLAKGYHSASTNFSRIQASGVSNILLRGKSYPRSCIVIDASSSMSVTFVDPDYGQISRFNRVKLYLEEALMNLTHQQQFNIIFFGSEVFSWHNGLVQATQPRITDALEFVRAQTESGSTNLNGALEAAYAIPDVAAVYLLSDGEPNVNYRGSDHLVSLVRRLSKDGSVPCHATSFFAPQAAQRLLRSITEASGGVYQEF